MSQVRRHYDRGAMQQSARRAKQFLALWIILLVAIVLALAFRVSQVVWPAWMIAYRTQIIGILLFVLVVTICLYPVIVEVTRNPRHLSGPGKNPEQGGGL